MRTLSKQALYYLLFLFALILPNIILLFTERLSAWGSACMLLLPLGLYMWALTAARKPGKPFLWLFPVLFLGAFQLVLLYLFKQGPIAVDMWLNLTTTNPSEADELLQQLSIPLTFVILLYVPVLVLAVRSLYRHEELSRRFRRRSSIAGCSLAFIGFLFGWSSYMFHGYNAEDTFFPYNACYNCYQAFVRAQATQDYHRTSKDFRYDARSSHTEEGTEIIVCVIGETSRAANWQLYGYDRPTNPRLIREKELIVYKDAMSQSNATHKSVPILLSPASAEDYDVLYTTKGVITAYKEAGFHTCFFSNQMRNHSFIDFLGEEAHESVFLKDGLTDNPKDEELLTYVQRAIHAGHPRLFIVLHTYGSHFDYNDRYTPAYAYFTPNAIEKANARYRNILVNAYDNTIRYTDNFLADILGVLKATEARSALLYTSDHGEDIYDDDRRLFLHASPYPSYYQLHVPFLIWTSHAYTTAYPEIRHNLQAHKDCSIDSNNAFHTLLDLGGITTNYKQDTLSLASPHFKEGPRHYLDDHNEPRRLKECLQKEDFAKMRQMGVGIN